MSNNRTQEVLYESEAALRLVDNELSELHEVQDSSAANPHSLNTQSDIALRLDRANSQIIAVLTRLREGRAAIENTAVGKLKVTQDKLREVTSATEDAATNIMDACDRANSLVDELDGIDAEPAPDLAKSATIRGSLRDELFLMMGALQFQDITSQQLAHASAVLDEMEQRMIEIAKLFDPALTFEIPKAPAPSNVALSYDANATTRDADSRQAVADEIFTAVKVNAA
ncbi:MAG: hypothetical protein ABI852_04745 [Gemmatimonadaceae bacterium]